MVVNSMKSPSRLWFCLCLASLTVATGGTKDCEANVDGTTTCGASVSEQNNNRTQDATLKHAYFPSSFCQDSLVDCEMRMNDQKSLCIEDFTFMSQHCAKTCHICSPRDPSPKTIVSHKKVTVDRIFAHVPQVLEGKSSIDTWLHMREVVEPYMYNQVYVNETFREVRAECKLRNELCTYWATIGECEKNPNFMQTNCAPACQSCLNLKFEHRCPFDQSGPTALSRPGDLNKLFQRIMTDPQFAVYEPKALSQPTDETQDDAPWLIVLENVLSPYECETLINAGAARGYKPSSEVGDATRFDGRRESTRSERRTSSTTWCKKECAQTSVARKVHDQLEALTGIPVQNYEHLQLLK